MKQCATLGVGFQALILAWGLASSLGACGAEPAPEPKTPETAAAPASAAEASPPAVESAPEPEADAKPEPDAKPEADAKPQSDGPPKDPNAMREVKYVVTPQGLKIEVAGVRFMASAEAKQVGQGWGAKVTVKAEVIDGKEHVLLNPKNGPIAFAAAIFKKDSAEAERIPDSREGEGELKLSPGLPKTFTRDFPNRGGRVLAIGETLDMEVALWGLGETKDDRRAVKQFFHVKMKVDKGKPKAKVEPPASAGS